VKEHTHHELKKKRKVLEPENEVSAWGFVFVHSINLPVMIKAANNAKRVVVVHVCCVVSTPSPRPSRRRWSGARCSSTSAPRPSTRRQGWIHTTHFSPRYFAVKTRLINR
jgi:hypothetical protein